MTRRGRPRKYCILDDCHNKCHPSSMLCRKHYADRRHCRYCGKPHFRQKGAIRCLECQAVLIKISKKVWKKHNRNLMKIYKSRSYYKWHSRNLSKALINYYLKRAYEVAKEQTGVGSKRKVSS